jgi:hypothetical protein
MPVGAQSLVCLLLVSPKKHVTSQQPSSVIWTATLVGGMHGERRAVCPRHLGRGDTRPHDANGVEGVERYITA